MLSPHAAISLILLATLMSLRCSPRLPPIRLRHTPLLIFSPHYAATTPPAAEDAYAATLFAILMHPQRRFIDAAYCRHA